ncbi:isoprenoid synthase domain-containing protein [Immersiella caudata]|uniref:Isoprenoid synthase domain-containing protein n=1 Tax=Immersiella caudata TaxID=314043 RepID=A0AA39WT69_9PEZI|nr:isoprenoid synthase domain-containing protein [Immersiella caudata]
MDHRFLVPVSPLGFDTQDLCEGTTVRAHKDSVLEDFGITKAQQDCIVSLAMPEYLPERLEIVSYTNEFGFLLDGMVEKVDGETGNAATTEMLDEGFLTSAAEKKTSGTRLLHWSAQAALNLWEEFLAKGGGCGDAQHTKMEEYIEIWSGLLLFGCAINIPLHETDACLRLCRRAWVACALTNDLFLWQKGHDAAVGADPEPVYLSSAIWVLRAEHGIDVYGAEDLCRQILRKNVAEFVAMVEEAKRSRGKYSLDLLRFLDAVQYTVCKNAA